MSNQPAPAAGREGERLGGDRRQSLAINGGGKPMQPDEKIRRAVMQLRNCIRWHEDVIKEQERYGQSFEAVRHREIIRQLLDQIYALERDAT